MLGSLLGLWMILFFLIAFLYSAVGHGGASGYLALMSFFLPYPELMKPIALLLNLVVSGIALVQFYRQGHFLDRKSTRLNSSHSQQSRMPSSA